MNNGKVIYHGPVQAGLAAILLKDDILFSNTPNPFRLNTEIKYQIGQSDKMVSLDIYNISGQLVKTLFHGRQDPGSYSVKWDGQNQRGTWAGNGVYICRLALGNKALVKRMTLFR